MDLPVLGVKLLAVVHPVLHHQGAHLDSRSVAGGCDDRIVGGGAGAANGRGWVGRQEPNDPDNFHDMEAEEWEYVVRGHVRPTYQ